MKFVYMLRSEAEPGRYYVGITGDLDDRLARHNHGDVLHTA
jgi:putative endonuclease